MNPTGLHAGAWIAGALAVSVVAIALHFLRVRRRRVIIDSLLFFRGSAQTVRPRVLGSRLARYLSLAVTMLAGLAAWFAFAETRGDASAASRVVLVDVAGCGDLRVGDRELSAVLLEEARSLVARAGIGPRGRVDVIGVEASIGLRADEPARLLDERAHTVEAHRDSAAASAHLLAARAGLHAGDELVVFGGLDPLPDSIDGVTVRRGRMPAATAVAAPETSPRALRVRVNAEIPASLELALDSVAAERVEDGDADLIVTMSGTTTTIPALILDEGSRPGRGRLRTTTACRAPLSLRDRDAGTMSGFAMRTDEIAWVVDTQGDIAYVSESRVDSGSASIRIATSLLADGAHHDTPALLLTALRRLAPAAFPNPALPRGLAAFEPSTPEAALAGDDLSWLLLCAILVLLAGDAWWFARGTSA
ncbi:MAG: hypothetical protein AB7I19_15265 [Planctomycetota bacterium]